MPGSRATPFFVQQADTAHDHTAVYGLAHIVDSKKPDADRRQGLHLDAGYMLGTDCHATPQSVVAYEFPQDIHTRDWYLMAERDERLRAFGGLYGRNARDSQDVPFARCARLHNRDRIGRHLDKALGYGYTVRNGLVAHVHHMGLTQGVEMGQAVFFGFLAVRYG